MSNVVDTNGWDTVAAIPYTDVNAAIVANSASPASFSQTAADGSASANGTFGQWSLTTGGAGPDLMMALPITGGTVTVGANSYPITPCIATVLVHATFLPQPANPSQHALRLSAAAVADPANVAAVQSLVPAQSNFLANAALQQLLQDWLNANLQSFNHVFAVVDLDAQFTVEGLVWLQPSFHGYAVAEPSTGATLANSVFGVMTMIDNNTTPAGLDYQVSPYAIPAGNRASFVISSEKFLQHMMFAAMPMIFKDIQDKPAANYFSITNDGTRITNTQGVTLQDTTLDNGNIVNPTIAAGCYHVDVIETLFVITIDEMSFEFSPGITVKLTYSGSSTMSLTSNDTLDLAITYQTGAGSVEVSKGLQITEIVLAVASVLLAIVAGVGGVVGKTASAAVESATAASLGAVEATGQEASTATEVTVTCCRSLISGTPQEVSQIAARCFTVAKIAGIGAFVTTAIPAFMGIATAIAQGKYESMPKITDLTDNAVGKAVTWPSGVPGYALASAQLNGCLQFGLNQA